MSNVSVLSVGLSAVRRVCSTRANKVRDNVLSKNPVFVRPLLVLLCSILISVGNGLPVGSVLSGTIRQLGSEVNSSEVWPQRKSL